MFKKLRSLFLSAIITSVLVTTSISDGISEKSKICFRTFVVQNVFYQVRKFHLRNFFLTGMASVSVESFRAISRKSSFLIRNNFWMKRDRLKWRSNLESSCLKVYSDIVLYSWDDGRFLLPRGSRVFGETPLIIMLAENGNSSERLSSLGSRRLADESDVGWGRLHAARVEEGVRAAFSAPTRSTSFQEALLGVVLPAQRDAVRDGESSSRCWSIPAEVSRMPSET